jgi:hypothetical protein
LMVGSITIHAFPGGVSKRVGSEPGEDIDSDPPQENPRMSKGATDIKSLREVLRIRIARLNRFVFDG